MTDALPVIHVTKAQIACAIGVSTRTVELYVRRGLLPPPLKMGSGRTSPVRWRPEDMETLRSNLAALAMAQRKAA